MNMNNYEIKKIAFSLFDGGCIAETLEIVDGSEENDD